MSGAGLLGRLAAQSTIELADQSRLCPKQKNKLYVVKGVVREVDDLSDSAVFLWIVVAVEDPGPTATRKRHAIMAPAMGLFYLATQKRGVVVRAGEADLMLMQVLRDFPIPVMIQLIHLAWAHEREASGLWLWAVGVVAHPSECLMGCDADKEPIMRADGVMLFEELC